MSRYSPWRPPKKYRPRDRPVMKRIVVKELEPTREERRRATWNHAEKYIRETEGANK